MAKYTVTRVCGHEETVALFGKNSQREWRLEHVEPYKLCEECYKIKLTEEREKANLEAAEAAKEMNLPELTGSEKQTAWAETIRQNMLAEIEKFVYTEIKKGRVDEPKILLALDGIKNKTAAKWWIDHRDHYYERGSIVALLGAELEAVIKEQSQPPSEVIADAKAEATVRPENPITETVAEIKALDNKVEIQFPERLDDFRELVKSLKYEWSGKCWRRTLSVKNGTSKDRAVETGHRLLAAGFSIRIFDESVRNNAITGEYEPECTNWVQARVKGEYQGWFAITWDYKDDYYKAARAIKGSKYSKPSVVVPPEQFEEVFDFAKMHGFKLSEKAQEIAERARKVKETALIVNVDPVPEKECFVASGKPPVLEVEEFDIADEFKD